MSEFHWDWDYIDQNMTVARMMVITKYWSKVPPLHVVVAAFTGALKKERRPIDGLQPVIEQEGTLPAPDAQPPMSVMDLAPMANALPGLSANVIKGRWNGLRR